MTDASFSDTRHANSFALELFRALPSEERNVVVSPTSAAVALALAEAGAGGTTARQIRDALHVGPEELSKLVSSLAALGAQRDGLEVKLASRVFADRHLDLYATYERDLSAYHCHAESVDFRGAPRESCRRMNAWASSATAGRIDKVVAESDSAADWHMVIANAIYLRAEWSQKFAADRTAQCPFMLTSGERVDVDTMSGVVDAGLHETSEASLLELAYRSDALRFCVLLPKQPGQLGALVDNLTASTLDSWIDAAQRRPVRVALPKLRIDPSLPVDLRPALTSLGIRDMFDVTHADFSRACAESTFVDKVTQKVFVAVTEEGTEAAAVTTSTMLLELPPPDIPNFMVNHPFLFIIRERARSSILFIGRVEDPRT